MVDGLLDHPDVRAISFVGSSAVARYVYSRAAANGKRAQCQGGAKNAVVVLPDADMETVTRIIAEASFGCAGQRCLATSVAITVGEARSAFTESIAHAAESRKVGYGLEPDIEMGPVITIESKQRIESLIAKGINEGARALVDGRNARISGYEQGNFVLPTILENVDPHGDIARTEIFGPVLSLTHVQTIDEAIALVNSASYGNMACLFTTSGASARKFRYEAQAGNIGINIGVAAPIAFFPFSGWKESFFGESMPMKGPQLSKIGWQCEVRKTSGHSTRCWRAVRLRGGIATVARTTSRSSSLATQFRKGLTRAQMAQSSEPPGHGSVNIFQQKSGRITNSFSAAGKTACTLAYQHK